MRRADGTAWALALLPALYVAHIGLHELGHAVAGALVGFRLRGVRAGPLAWSPERGLGFNRAALAGVTGATRADPPVGAPGLRWRAAAYVAGGPGASLLGGMLGLVVALAPGVPDALAGPALAWGLLGAASTAGALLLGHAPVGGVRAPSDGRQLVDLLVRWPAVRARWRRPPP